MLGDRAVLGGHPVSDAENREGEKLCVDTIRRFKGLESPVVILVVGSEMLTTPELLYVGVTRAQAHLTIAGSRAAITAMHD